MLCDFDFILVVSMLLVLCIVQCARRQHAKTVDSMSPFQWSNTEPPSSGTAVRLCTTIVHTANMVIASAATKWMTVLWVLQYL